MLRLVAVASSSKCEIGTSILRLKADDVFRSFLGDDEVSDSKP